MSDAIREMDATGQAELVSSGEVSPRELVEIAVNRAKEVNPEVNAIIAPLSYIGASTYLRKIALPADLSPSLSMGLTMQHPAAIVVPTTNPVREAMLLVRGCSLRITTSVAVSPSGIAAAISA